MQVCSVVNTQQQASRGLVIKRYNSKIYKIERQNHHVVFALRRKKEDPELNQAEQDDAANLNIAPSVRHFERVFHSLSTFGS